MELREYVRILVKSWWLILPMTLIALTLTVFFSYSQTPIYESVSTYVTRLDPALGSIDDTIYGLDTLTGRQRIFVTYCEVMTSNSGVNRGLEMLSIAPGAIDMKKYDIMCNVLPESNVLMLIVHGPVPALVERLNQAIGLAGIERVNQLYNYFPIEALDNVLLEEDPISPNHISNMILGGIMGVMISVTLALLLEHFRRPGQQLEALSIRDPHLNVYKDSYFQRRLGEEVNRARNRNRPVCIGFLKLLPDEDFSLLPEEVQLSLLRSASIHIQDSFREGDIVAHRGNAIFEILIPEMSGHEVRTMLERVVADVRGHTHTSDRHVANFSAVAIVIEGSGYNLDVQSMQKRGLAALEQAHKTGQPAIQLISTAPSPFFDNGQDGGTFDFVDLGHGEESYLPIVKVPEVDTKPDATTEPDIEPDAPKTEEEDEYDLGKLTAARLSELRSKKHTGILSSKFRSEIVSEDNAPLHEETETRPYEYVEFVADDFKDDKDDSQDTTHKNGKRKAT